MRGSPSSSTSKCRFGELPASPNPKKKECVQLPSRTRSSQYKGNLDRAHRSHIRTAQSIKPAASIARTASEADGSDQHDQLRRQCPS